MVGTGADNADVDAVLFVPAGIAIYDVDSISSIEVIDGSFSVDLPDLSKLHSQYGGSSRAVIVTQGIGSNCRRG